ncbi:hypothetical protein SAY87_028060 [Trapa incisa]|uniref:Uncharacterized protein n=1 Tax=Trapa incisa TaxID=236973 RepID=A0AAN7QPD4_9MYRT|nr:hypothetical protein SAY87_028060 [Trapa incisa]
MDDSARKGTRDIKFASRKVEEADCRRYQAVEWLDSIVGPLELSSQPSESDFISCLRSGRILCNAINKVHPGAVPKVVENKPNQKSPCGEIRPLRAFQYFENVKNFLVAIQGLKLPAFEASDLEKDNLEARKSARVVDCILGLKAYHERKQAAVCGDGLLKQTRSPTAMHFASGIHAKGRAPPHSLAPICQKQPSPSEEKMLKESLVRMLANYMAEEKENFDGDLPSKAKDPVKSLGKIFSTCVDYPQLNAVFENFCAKRDRSSVPSTPSPLEEHSSSTGRSVVCSTLEEHSSSTGRSVVCSTLEEHSSSTGGSVVCSPLEEHSSSTGVSVVCSPLEEHSSTGGSECDRSFLRESESNCNHWQKIQLQQKELSAIKNMLSEAKTEFEELQCRLQRDLKEIDARAKEMSMAALGYHRLVKENRDLYNIVQDLKGNIRVYCRIRPVFNDEAGSIVDFIGQDDSLAISDPSKPQSEGRKIFNFNKVFGPTCSQNDIYADIQPLIRSVMDGYNVCIFAYGQTGSGKTHTMSCPSDGSSEEDMGISHLALNDLFRLSNMRKDDAEYEIQVQMVEIYNEQVRDLLKFEICSADGGSMSLSDATMHSVKSTADVIRLMKLGDDNRVISSSTALNDRSSRSHSILTVQVSGKEISGCTLQSCLHFVDLASSSERVENPEEAMYINKSLSCLGDVITALAQKNSHIPYRNSKLTLLLQDSLSPGGRTKTLMFAHINPERDSFAETISTLKFAQRVSTDELGGVRGNKECSEVMQLKEQVERLKEALGGNKGAQSVQSPSIRRISSSAEKPKAYLDRTPPRPRRLSMENIKNEKPGKTTPGAVRSRRLSIEGSRVAEKNDAPEGGAILTPRNVNLQEMDAAPSGSVTKQLVGKTESKQRVAAPPRSPVRGSSVVSSKARASRRQSLTGIPLPGIGGGGADTRPRRSSLGGKPVGSTEAYRNHWAVGPFNTVMVRPDGRKDKCIEWLDRHPKNSVMYVSFGTTVALSKDHIHEIALGLEGSGHRFIWVLREADKGDIFSRETPEGRETAMIMIY